MILDGCFDYDDSVTLLRPSRIARSLAILAPLSLSVHAGCSDAATDGPEGPRFMPNGAAGSAPVSNGPAATPPATDTPSAPAPGPTPAGTEQPPAPGAIDNG